MATLFRCRICGESYLMGDKPSHCPICGAHEQWIVSASAYVEPELPDLTDISLKNLVFTYDLEVNASRIYHCIRKKTNDEYILGMFKAISKVELEHAELVGKLIGKDPGCEIIFTQKLCTSDREESLNKTKLLETDAIRHYTKFLKEATELRVKDIFQALIEVENDHLDLVKESL